MVTNASASGQLKRNSISIPDIPNRDLGSCKLILSPEMVYEILFPKLNDCQVHITS